MVAVVTRWAQAALKLVGMGTPDPLRVCVIGLPASGKKTLVRRLADVKWSVPLEFAEGTVVLDDADAAHATTSVAVAQAITSVWDGEEPNGVILLVDGADLCADNRTVFTALLTMKLRTMVVANKADTCRPELLDDLLRQLDVDKPRSVDDTVFCTCTAIESPLGGDFVDNVTAFGWKLAFG